MRPRDTGASDREIPLTFRDYFLTGLAVILPLWITGYVLWILVRVTGNLIFPIVRPWLRQLLQTPPPEPLLISVAALVVLFLIWALGYLIIHVVGHGHLERIEGLIARVPLARTIHGVAKRLVEIFLSAKGRFRSVAVVEFPLPGQYTIGFVTRQQPIAGAAGELVPVLVPTAPNPTSGFLLLVPKDKVRYVDLNLDDAMALIVSAGTFGPGVLPQPPAVEDVGRQSEQSHS